MKILVLGGKGFIGRHIVDSARKNGAQVLVGSRRGDAQSQMPVIQMQKMLQIQDWQALLQTQNFKANDVVVNTVGILRERPNESYTQVHYLAVAALAQACASMSIRLVHISAIGLTAQAKSGFILSKLAAEQAILQSQAQAIIVRPSLLDGAGGYGAKWFRHLARWPIQFVMTSEGLVAPLQVQDLGEAVAKICTMNFSALPNIIELGGNDVMTIAQYLTVLRKSFQKPTAWQITLPKIPVRLISHIFDLFAWTPLSFGHFELMQGRNVPANNLLPNLLGRKPSALGVSSDAVFSANQPNKIILKPALSQKI